MEELARLAATRKRRPKTRGHLVRSKRARRETTSFLLFIMPWILGFIGLSVFPLALGFITSLSNFDGLNLATVRFVGLDNYARAFTKPLAQSSLGNSFKYAIIVVPVGLTLSFLLAVMLNRPIKGRDLFRLIYYLPAILPLAGASRAWQLLFGTNVGAINALIRVFRPGTAIDWLLDYPWPVLFLYAWWGAGQGMVIFLSGLQGIPQELYEAARLDGANRLQLLYRVTLPLMTPVIYFQLILNIIAALQVFQGPVLIFSGHNVGDPVWMGRVDMPQHLYTYMIYVFTETFRKSRYGYGVALAWIFFVVVLIVTLIVIKTSRYWVYYEVAQEGEAR